MEDKDDKQSRNDDDTVTIRGIEYVRAKKSDDDDSKLKDDTDKQSDTKLGDDKAPSSEDLAKKDEEEHKRFKDSMEGHIGHRIGDGFSHAIKDFDPKERQNVQAAEHYGFVDEQYKKYGHL